MDPQSLARASFTELGFLILSDLPKGSEFGLDGQFWTTNEFNVSPPISLHTVLSLSVADTVIVGGGTDRESNSSRVVYIYSSSPPLPLHSTTTHQRRTRTRRTVRVKQREDWESDMRYSKFTRKEKSFLNPGILRTNHFKPSPPSPPVPPPLQVQPLSRNPLDVVVVSSNPPQQRKGRKNPLL